MYFIGFGIGFLAAALIMHYLVVLRRDLWTSPLDREFSFYVGQVRIFGVRQGQQEAQQGVLWHSVSGWWRLLFSRVGNDDLPTDFPRVVSVQDKPCTSP